MISFWKKESGSLMSYRNGLTKEQIQFLQGLREGDRLVLWDNSKSRYESKSDFTLKLARPKPIEVQEKKDGGLTGI